MFTQKRELALVVVEFGGLFPAAFTVAIATFFAQGFFVFVVLLMAGKTVLRQFFTVKVAFMAGVAGNAAVFATQRVFGVGVVVEGAVFPLHRVVAGFAFFTIQAFMAFVVVVLFMAGVAVEWCVFVFVVLVAIHTLYVSVFAFELKFSGAVVKLGFFPVGFVVAVKTFGTQ
jgi:hypothetical protein